MSALVTLGAATLALVVARRLLGSRALDVTSLSALRAPYNRFTFRRRAAGKRRPRHVTLSDEPKDALFAYLSGAELERARARETALRERYGLEPLRRRSTCAAYRENLAVLDVLDRHDGAWTRPESVRVIDVGSKDFVYAFALAAFARGGDRRRAVDVTGVEIDGNVRLPDGTTRADLADAYAAQAGARFEVLDFLAFESGGPVNLLTMFYPFVTRFALLQWGLPESEFRPEAILSRAVSMLDAAGRLVIVNHTHEERDALAALLAGVPGLRRVASGPATSALVDYAADVGERWITVLERQSEDRRQGFDATATRSPAP